MVMKFLYSHIQIEEWIGMRGKELSMVPPSYEKENSVA